MLFCVFLHTEKESLGLRKIILDLLCGNGLLCALVQDITEGEDTLKWREMKHELQTVHPFNPPHTPFRFLLRKQYHQLPSKV